MSNKDELPIWSHATHCNTLQHTATHCNTLQYTTTHCSTLRRHNLRMVAHICSTVAMKHFCPVVPYIPQRMKNIYIAYEDKASRHCSVLQCAAVCCSVLQCVAVCCIHSVRRQGIKASYGDAQPQTSCALHLPHIEHFVLHFLYLPRFNILAL